MITIVKLAFAPEFAPECASWLYNEWGHRYPAATLADVTKRFLARANIDEVPIAFVAHQGGKPVGTASLIAKEDLSDTYGPWVASVFVPEAYRGMGIARRLIEMTETEAARLGFPQVWLSAAAPMMYEKLGYQPTDHEKHGEPVMVKRLSIPKLQD
ncbi:GNAT family N-acetyltransferase [Paracoccus sp. 228]|uniref:GNAT family N-acetyltransferase n=1 Tax=Paracoccus sp. 228 TaxID=1192054 RepID=UPI000A02E808|nr:GNAT family N-acetyltransferase [Paracoccus sp. 228]